MNDPRADASEGVAAMRAAQAQRRFDEAALIAESICARDPAQEDAVGFLVGFALARGEVARAIRTAQAAVRANADSARLQFQWGLALSAAERFDESAQAFSRALALDPALYVAPLWQADCEIARGREAEALGCRVRALDIAERRGLLTGKTTLAPPIQERIDRATAAVRAARREHVESVLAPVRARHGAAAIARIDRALARWHGEPAPAPTHPLQQPTLLFVPELPDRAWFERDQFPHLHALEAATDVIRDELLGVLADDQGLVPYVDMPDSAPAAPMWRTLNRSPAWSGFHLYRHGQRAEANCARCPNTLAVLESLPLMRIAEHAPEILFSVLAPHTHIPPHTGVINGRLTVHLPLIVPAHCGALRAADEQREWKEGECLIFDDSFVHEAWNDSDHTRVVLILDAWNPHLRDAERESLGAAIEALGEFHRRHGGGEATRTD